MFPITKKIIKSVKRRNAEKKYGDMKLETISFGEYPQSNQKTAEPIEWLVLKKENNKALLLSEKILNMMIFDTSSADFAKSDVRNWLNGQFYNTAFSDEEKARMVTLNGSADKVSLLSYEEATALLPAESLRRRIITEAAKKGKTSFDKKTGMGSWMLRSTNFKAYKTPSIYVVGHKGEIDPLPIEFFKVAPFGVVPAIIITL